MSQAIEEALNYLARLNPAYNKKQSITTRKRPYKLQKVLIANRGEIAKRFFFSLKEEGIPSVAIVTEPDIGQSWHEFADEVLLIGDIANYTNIPVVIAAALMTNSNAIYPGYGFLSENFNFVDSIKEASKEYNKEIIFMGPDSSIMKKVGDKLAARKLAIENGIPLFKGTSHLEDVADAHKAAEEIGYPVIVKLSAGGGGKGMMPVHSESGLFYAIEYAKRIGRSLYNNEVFYLEKFIEKPVHMEVQIFNGTAIGIRKCAVQRRNQKVIEESGDIFLDSHMILSILAASENMARISGYSKGAGAGTVEFLYDQESGHIGFLEMNTRLQVEHPVTDQSLGIDLAKWQVLYFDGRENEINYLHALEQRFIQKDHSIECRIYAEDPEMNYAPSPGKILDIELPTFNGIRCDFGFKKGDAILPYYDPMIGKLIARGINRQVAIARIERALSELFIKGITTNVNQLLHIVRHPEFKKGAYSNRLLNEHPELENPPQNPNDIITASIMGAITENARLISEAAYECFMSTDLENSVQSRKYAFLSYGYHVDAYNQINEIRLLQTALNTTHIFLNRKYVGEAEIITRTTANDDYLIRYGVMAYSIKVDKRPSYTTIRMKDSNNHVHYYRMKIVSDGIGDKVDPHGMIRSPFRGSFVKFAKDEHQKRDRITIGSYIKKGDPILILSAMKMETTITAPISGKIVSLIEDGDLSRLQLGVTIQGEVVGKSIAEGEILFVVEDESKKNEENFSAISQESSQAIEIDSDHESTLSYLFRKDLKEIIFKKPESSIPELIQLLRAFFQGFISGDEILSQIVEIIQEIPDSEWKKMDKSGIDTEIINILLLYTNIKQVYSPTIGNNLSLFTELNQYVLRWMDETYTPSVAFKSIMNQLFKLYGVNNWLSNKQSEQVNVQLVLFNIQRAYHLCLDHPHIIHQLLKIIDKLEPPARKLTTVLKKLVALEESERDDSLADDGKALLNKFNVSLHAKKNIPISRKYLIEYKKLNNDPYSVFQKDTNSIKNEMILSLKNSIPELIPSEAPEWVRKDLKLKIAIMEKSFTVIRHYSPLSDVLFYGLASKENIADIRYLSIAYCGKPIVEYNNKGEIISSPNIELSVIHASEVLTCFQSIERRQKNRLEVFAHGEEVILDLGGTDPKVLNFWSLNHINMGVNHFLKNLQVPRMIVHIKAKSPFGGDAEIKQFTLYAKDGDIIPDLLLNTDRQSPYFVDAINPLDQKIFDKNKWPIEVWTKECFDPDSYHEIKIPSIDAVAFYNTKTNKEEFKPVGSKIFVGKVGGIDALFYMKDSRINGGASGNLEGLKYIASAYIAYRSKIPLYVWNDGAGANIKEGMASLNRAGQGFMMNSLISSRANEKEFRTYTNENPDPTLRDLFKELDSILPLGKVRGKNCFIVAVGVGSSTGLDVYGSSQTAIQIMLDTDESYRVLTGSNVIKSVTGEDFTNYQIGGAKVMGKWTGTVDLVAENKIQLLTLIRKIQETFCDYRTYSEIRRLSSSKSIELQEVEVINDDVVKANSDNGKFLPFKEEYHGTGSLLGGFVKLGGRCTLIMGTRNKFGIRSFSTITRAKELIQIANKTNSAIVIVFGDKWYYRTQNEDPLSVRARQDSLKVFQNKSGAKVLILTSIKSFDHVTMNTFADATVYVKEPNLSARELHYVQKTAAFIVENMTEAFDVTHKIIEYFESNQELNTNYPIDAIGSPILPSEPSQPYNMIESIIDKVFDKNSFLEFYKNMNDPITGPCLITGLARLNGMTVGVIADQPMILGGAPDAPGTEKYRIFTELMNINRIPIIMLSNAPGFVPGTRQERLRIQQIGAESLDANILSHVPVVSVVLNQNFGGRQIHAFSKVIRPGIVYLALENSVMAVMGATASFDLFFGAKYKDLISQNKIEDAKALREKYILDYNTKAAAKNDAFTTGVIDWLIPKVDDLREHLIKGLEEAIKRTRKIWGNN